jgi:hypothetical protein
MFLVEEEGTASTFRALREVVFEHPGGAATRPSLAVDEAGPDRIGDDHEHDRDGRVAAPDVIQAHGGPTVGAF